MKLLDYIFVTKLGNEFVAVPTGAAAAVFHGVIRLNVTGKDIFQGLIDGLSVEEIAAKLVEDYDGVDLATAKKCTEDMIEKLRGAGLVTD